MGFGCQPTAAQDLLLVALKVLTTLRWEQIAEAYIHQFSPTCQPTAGDCRNRWARPLKTNPARLALEAEQPLEAADDQLVRAYLQAEGIHALNALGVAFLNAPSLPPVPGAPASVPAPTATAPSGPPAQAPPGTVNFHSASPFHPPLQGVLDQTPATDDSWDSVFEHQPQESAPEGQVEKGGHPLLGPSFAPLFPPYPELP
jgi:hypothetical protein